MTVTTKKINLNNLKMEKGVNLFPKGRTTFVKPERTGNLAIFINSIDMLCVIHFSYDHEQEQNYLSRLVGDFYSGHWVDGRYTKKQAKIKQEELEREYEKMGYTIRYM